MLPRSASVFPSSSVRVRRMLKRLMRDASDAGGAADVACECVLLEVPPLSLGLKSRALAASSPLLIPAACGGSVEVMSWLSVLRETAAPADRVEFRPAEEKAPTLELLVVTTAGAC